MARYKEEYDYSQGKFIPIHFDRHILPRTFEYSLHYLIDNEIDLSIFDCRYRNDEMGLIGKEMFAVDGCKLPPNASKEWSGTKGELEKKREKLEKVIRQNVKRHREADEREADRGVNEQEEQYVETLRRKVKKITVRCTIYLKCIDTVRSLGERIPIR